MHLFPCLLIPFLLLKPHYLCNCHIPPSISFLPFLLLFFLLHLLVSRLFRPPYFNSPSPPSFIEQHAAPYVATILHPHLPCRPACRSRLGCQIIACKDLDGMVVHIPSATRNMAVDGFRPKPH